MLHVELDAQQPPYQVEGSKSVEDGGVLWIEKGSKHEELMRVEVKS